MLPNGIASKVFVCAWKWYGSIHLNEKKTACTMKWTKFRLSFMQTLVNEQQQNNNWSEKDKTTEQ